MNAPPAKLPNAQVLVIGSGAGGATVAATLAEAGLDVVVLEEGPREETSSIPEHTPEAMERLYRRRGMTPMIGSPPMGFVEGCCIGGSTEINSGFWHRTPREILLRWAARYGLREALSDDLAEHFAWAEAACSVSRSGELPEVSRRFARGAEVMGWAADEIPRMVKHEAGGKPQRQGMSRTLVPAAEAAGARFVPNCRATLLLRSRGRVTGVLAELQRDDATELAHIPADFVFVCAGSTQTPALLRRSGIRYHVGDSLQIHPMLKVVAVFDEPVDAATSALPLLQVKEFWPDVSFGGAYFSPGHVALTAAHEWPGGPDVPQWYRNAASYYVAVRGTGRGSVRPGRLDPNATTVRYDLSRRDVANLSDGLARLATMLLAAGAREVRPAIWGLAPMRTELDAIRWLDDRLDRRALNLTTVHAFSTCPAGEVESRCAVDSFGRVLRHENLFVCDGSILPDSPGVNPQGTIMALARRNALAFASHVS